MLIASTDPEPPLALNVIVAGARAGIDTVADATTDAPVQEPLDDFTLPFIVAVVAVVVGLVKVFLFHRVARFVGEHDEELISARVGYGNRPAAGRPRRRSRRSVIDGVF